MTNESTASSTRRRLSSWKEIAAFVGRDERTVKRWESSRDLPVRRVPGAGHAAVFAYVDEVESWLRGDASVETSGAQPGTEVDAAASHRPWPRVAGALLVLLASAALAAAALSYAVMDQLPRSAVEVHTNDPVAAELYRSGLHAWQTRTPNGLARAISDFNDAIARDPRFAAAYAGLANAYNLDAEFAPAPSGPSYARAGRAARQAIALEPGLASAHAALAYDDFYWSRERAAADREFRRAIQLDPSDANAHHWYATYLMTVGQYGAALREIGKAESLDPESTAIPADRGLILFHAGRTEEAERLLTQLESDQPEFSAPHRYLAAIRFTQGNDAAYVRELRLTALIRHDGDGASIADAGARGLAAGGHAGMLRAIYDRQRALYSEGRQSAYALATTCAELSDLKDTLSWLATSFAHRETDSIIAGIDWPFAPYRNDPRFLELVAKAGFNAPHAYFSVSGYSSPLR